MPSFQAHVARLDFRVQIPIGEVQVPIGVLDVAQQITDPDLEFGQTDIRSQPGNQHAIVNAGTTTRTGDAVEVGPAAAEKRMAEFPFQEGIPSTVGKLVSDVVVPIVFDNVTDGELAARHRPLRDFSLNAIKILIEETSLPQELVVQTPIIFFTQCAGREFRVKSRQRRFDAQLGSRLLDRRIKAVEIVSGARNTVPPRSCMTLECERA